MRNSRRLRRLLVIGLLPLVCGACRTTHGARTLQPTRLHYSEALGRSWNEHLLLNLVRLRYRDTVQFMTVGEIVTQYSFNGSATAGVTLDFDGDNDGAAGGGISYSETPTITYRPLHGEAFVKRMLAPLPPDSLMLLANAGWSIERLMMCCVYRVNGIENTRNAAGPTPDYPPIFGEFKRLSAILRELQKRELIRITLDETRVRVQLLDSDDEAMNAKVAEVRELLGIDPREMGQEVVSDYDAREPGQLALVGRSLLAVLFYLSHGVKPPVEHEQVGLVTITPDETGAPLDWWDAMSDILRVPSSSEPPADAFVRIKYRGYWFYIDDHDLHSKSTFQLLTYLFSMQATAGPDSGPLLTLMAGG